MCEPLESQKGKPRRGRQCNKDLENVARACVVTDPELSVPSLDA
jgi:hypothetical protein